MRQLARRLVPLVVLGATACASVGTGASADTFIPPSRPAQLSLAGIPWGIARDSVTALVRPRGYNYNRTDEDGDMWFDGLVYRQPTRVFAFMANDRLVKFRMQIGTPDEDAVPVYEQARAELLKQFGTPVEVVEHYRAPYKKGDGRQEEAIREGKADLTTYWLLGSAGRQTFVSISVTPQLTVMVDYEGPAWEEENVRRRRAAAR